jgi:hypothetical protein
MTTIMSRLTRTRHHAAVKQPEQSPAALRHDFESLC